MTQKTQVCIQPARKPHVILSACWRESSSETGSRPQATEFLTQGCMAWASEPGFTNKFPGHAGAGGSEGLLTRLAIA